MCNVLSVIAIDFVLCICQSIVIVRYGIAENIFDVY